MDLCRLIQQSPLLNRNLPRILEAIAKLHGGRKSKILGQVGEERLRLSTIIYSFLTSVALVPRTLFFHQRRAPSGKQRRRVRGAENLLP